MVAGNLTGVVSDDLLAATRPRHPLHHPLEELVGWLRDRDHRADLTGGGTLEVSGISLSSQRVQAGDLYAALPGSRAHGATYAKAAVAQGAVAVLTDDEGAALLAGTVPALVVERPRSVLGALSAHVYGDPATRLRPLQSAELLATDPPPSPALQSASIISTTRSPPRSARRAPARPAPPGRLQTAGIIH